MIRINLLGTSKHKGKAQPMPVLPTEGPNPVLVAFVVFVITGGGLFFAYQGAQKKQKEIATQITDAQREADSLKQIKQKYDKREKEKDEYEKRVKVIEQLRLNQSGPVDLLTMMGDTVSRTDEVWLSDMHEEGNNIKLKGTALSTTAVANFITNLMKTGYFKNVEIEQTAQDPAEKEVSAFDFSLVCERNEKKS